MVGRVVVVGFVMACGSDPRDASLVAAAVGTAEDITIVSTTPFADGSRTGR